MQKTYSRGDMYYANLGKGVGSEQEGYRPVVIIQNNVGNRFNPTVIISAISSKVGVKPRLPTHYFIDGEDSLKLPTIILMEQLFTIDKHRGYSTGVQFKQSADYAVNQLSLPEDYEFQKYEDKGLSGYYSDRPDFQRLLHDIEMGKIRAVACYKLDVLTKYYSGKSCTKTGEKMRVSKRPPSFSPISLCVLPNTACDFGLCQHALLGVNSVFLPSRGFDSWSRRPPEPRPHLRRPWHTWKLAQPISMLAALPPGSKESEDSFELCQGRCEWARETGAARFPRGFVRRTKPGGALLERRAVPVKTRAVGLGADSAFPGIWPACWQGGKRFESIPILALCNNFD